MRTKGLDLEFHDIVSHIVALYRLGVLVPFIGSGMSLPVCTNWVEFLKSLAKEARVDIPRAFAHGDKVEAQVLYRLADATVAALRPLPHDKRSQKYRNALRAWRNDERLEIPVQTKSLASLFWPLVVTTNYDDLYWSAAASTARPDVRGRSLEDCHRVLRSLDENSPPILWTVQGFLGGQYQNPEIIIEDAIRRRDLVNQLVVGHQQYQRAINSENHFRRSFAEVFRRRSFLFLGSGLLEDYLVNLFGEIIHHHGPGPHPHFALINIKERERFNSAFLQTRMGIVPVFYKDHSDLPHHLNDFCTLVNYWPDGKQSSPAPATLTLQFDEIGFTIFPTTRRAAQPSIKVRVCKSPIPLPDPNLSECSVVSVGRRNNLPLVGKQADSLLKRAKEAKTIEGLYEAEWIPLDKIPPYAYRYGDTPIFGISARRKNLKGANHDRRDLGIIPEAICEALSKIDAAGFEVVHMGAIASGKHRPWHPIYPFVQTLRGIREFITKGKLLNTRLVNLYIVDPAVWYPLLARKIPVAELLSSSLTTHRVDLTDNEGNNESFAVTLRESPTLKELLKQCDIDSELWKAETFPRTTDEQERKEPEPDMIVTPSMTVVLTPHH